MTEHQGPAQEAEKPGNRLREGGREGGGFLSCQVQNTSGACLASPTPPSLALGKAVLCIPGCAGWAVKEKEGILGKLIILAAPCSNMAVLRGV